MTGKELWVYLLEFWGEGKKTYSIFHSRNLKNIIIIIQAINTEKNTNLSLRSLSVEKNDGS